MDPLSLVDISTAGAAVILIGAAGVILLPKPLDKVIMFALLQGGFVTVLAAAKYLDVAFAVAVFDPISTIILLVAIIKLNDIRRTQIA